MKHPFLTGTAVLAAALLTGAAYVNADALNQYAMWACDTSGIAERSCNMTSPAHGSTYAAGQSITIAGWQVWEFTRSQADAPFTQWVWSRDEFGTVSPVKPPCAQSMCVVPGATIGQKYSPSYYSDQCLCNYPAMKTYNDNGLRCRVVFAITSTGGTPGHTDQTGIIYPDAYSLGIQDNIVPTKTTNAAGDYYKCSASGTFTIPPIASLPSRVQADIAKGVDVYATIYPVWYWLDNTGATGGANQGPVYEHIKISDPNQAPTAYITSANPAYDPVGEYSSGNRTIQVSKGTSVTLNGRGTDADGSVSVYEWREGNSCDTGGTVTNAQTKTIDTTNLALGSHKYYFSVIDNQSKRSVGCPYVNVVVIASQCKNVPTNAVACPNSATDNIDATLQASCANAATIKCLYQCSDGYLVSGNSCIADNWCGNAHGAQLTTRPTTQLCRSDATGGVVSDTATGWSWSCSKGTVRSDCSAFKKVGGNR